MQDAVMLVLFSLALLASGCGERAVQWADASAVRDQGDGSPRTSSETELDRCQLPPGVHGFGPFDGGPPSTSQTEASLSTDLSKIEVVVPVQKGASVLIQLEKRSTNPALPERLDLGQLPPAPEDWEASIEHAWCNAMECRIDFYAASVEPTDTLEGSAVFEGALVSDLSRVAVCVVARDGSDKRLQVNVVAAR